MLGSDGAIYDATVAKIVGVPARATASERILVISDDYQLRVLICELIVAHGFTSVLSATSVTALASSDQLANCDVAIIDSSVAHSDAMRAFRKLQKGGIASIVLIGGKDIEPTNADIGTNGAVLLATPFDPRELMLVIRGMVHRRAPPSPAKKSESLVVGPLGLHTLLNVATVADREIELTGVETRILEELLTNASNPVSRDRLTHRALGREWSPLDRCLDTHIKHLRRKIGEDRSGRTPIRTIRGIGYLILADWQPLI